MLLWIAAIVISGVDVWLAVVAVRIVIDSLDRRVGRQVRCETDAARRAVEQITRQAQQEIWRLTLEAQARRA
jgi:hypothetical protein